jgi:glycosyltransferase involved in cell wall biosynthesis
VHRSWTHITPNKGFLKKSMGHASFWLSAALFSSRKIPPVDCVIGSSPTFFAAMAARAKARRDGVPFIMEVRDLWPAIFVDLGVIKNRRIIRLLEFWELSLYRSATRIVTVTDSFRENLIARGVPARKVVTITNGADTEYWRRDHADGSKLRDGLKLEGSFVVLYIGAHGISQGLGALIKAAARLKSRRDIRFVFVGEGADKPKLEAEAARLDLTNVTFLPPVGKEAVRAYYSLADLCVVPLRNIPLFDTFIPSKMFEIMATGRPILASLGGEAADILGRSGAAQVVKPEDDAAIAAAIVEAAANPQLLEAMAKCGPNFVRTHYARSLLAGRYLNLIQEAREEMGLTV